MRHSVDPHLPFVAALFLATLRARDFFDRYVLLHTHQSFQPFHKTVFLRMTKK